MRSVGSYGPKVSSCGQRRLIRLGGCPGWSESSLGAHILLVLLCCGSHTTEPNEEGKIFGHHLHQYTVLECAHWHHYEEGQQHYSLPAKKFVTMPKSSREYLLQDICETSSRVRSHSMGPTYHREHQQGWNCPAESSEIRDWRLSLYQQCHSHKSVTWDGKASYTEDCRPKQ